MLKRKSFVRQRLMFVALVFAVCSFTIALNWPGPPTAKLARIVQRSISPPLTQLERVSSFTVPEEFQGKIISQTTLPLREKAIALTFDDGPWPRTTEQVLDILKQNDIKATFFWISKNVKNRPEIAQLVVDAGHVIGNHTWHHWYKRMDPATAAREIEDTAAQIYETTGVKTFLFRPPGGILNNGPASYAEQKNYAVMTWSADSRDWFYRRTSPSVLVNNVLKEARPGGIVLMHDGGGNRSKTVKALPEIIAGLRQRGYKFVTVPELLALKGSPEEAPATSLSKLKDRELKLMSRARTTVGAGKKPQVKQPQQLAD